MYLEQNSRSITLDIHASTNEHPPKPFLFQATQCKQNIGSSTRLISVSIPDQSPRTLTTNKRWAEY